MPRWNQRSLAKAYAEDHACTLRASAAALQVVDSDCYSYATIIFRKYPHRYQGKQVVWETNLRYSVTTSKHCTFVGGALAMNRGYFFIYGENPPPYSDKKSIIRLCDLQDKENMKHGDQEGAD